MNWAPAHLGPRELRDVYALPVRGRDPRGRPRLDHERLPRARRRAVRRLAGAPERSAARRARLRRRRGGRLLHRRHAARVPPLRRRQGRRRAPCARGRARRRAAGDRLLRRAAARGAGREARSASRSSTGPCGGCSGRSSSSGSSSGRTSTPRPPPGVRHRAAARPRARAGPEVDRAAAERGRPAAAAEDAAPSRGDRTLGADASACCRATTTIRRISRSCSARSASMLRRRGSSRAGSASTSARTSRRMVSLLDGIRAAVSPATDDRGRARLRPARPERRTASPAAVDAAREADVAIVCVGGKSGLVDGCTSGESIDRVHARPSGRAAAPGRGDRRHGHADRRRAGRRPTARDPVDRRARAGAVLHAWLPGEEGGHAVADVLFGDADPGGRLPVSMPRSVGQLPVFYGAQAVGRPLALERHLRRRTGRRRSSRSATGSPTRASRTRT